MLQGEIIPKKMRLLYFHEESIHEVSRRYFIPEYHFLTLTQGRVHTKIQNGCSQKLLCRSELNFI